MIKDNLHEINSKLPSDVTLVAVSKFHPVERLMEAYNAGQRVFAESRPQELAAKVPQMPADVQWHFIGHLQTNKLKLVLPYVSLVQSVDSLHLLQAISAWAVAHNKVMVADTVQHGQSHRLCRHQLGMRLHSLQIADVARVQGAGGRGVCPDRGAV